MQRTRERISPAPESEADRLNDAILRTLAYYDLFDYPLTAVEIERYCDLPVDDHRVVLRRLAALKSRQVVGEEDGFWFLAEREAEIVSRRIAMERRGLELWEVAERFARLMRHVPFIRAVMISGQLSRYVADRRSDIDYFIVTRPGRLWIARTILVLLRRTLLLNDRTFFCTNFFVTTDNLEIDERNIYAACETASVKPIWNRALHREFMASNQWITEFYPNHSPAPELFISGIPDRPSRLQRLLERLLPSGLADRLDRRLMLKTREHWRRKFPEMNRAVRNRSMRSTPTESRAHAGDYAPRVLTGYRHELVRRGIEPVEEIGVRVREVA